MYEKSFFKRLYGFGFIKIIVSYDTIIALIAFILLLKFANDDLLKNRYQDILNIFINTSASLFAIILAGLAIITSFTDKDFLYVWKKLGEFDNIITLFQYNLFLPILILSYSLILKFTEYNYWAIIILISLFSYMIFSLLHLINFICRYGLQRGEFIQQLKDLEHSKKK